MLILFCGETSERHRGSLKATQHPRGIQETACTGTLCEWSPVYLRRGSYWPGGRGAAVKAPASVVTPSARLSPREKSAAIVGWFWRSHLTHRGLSFPVCKVDAISHGSRPYRPEAREGLRGRVPRRGRGPGSGRTWRLPTPRPQAAVAPSSAVRAGAPQGAAAQEPAPTAGGAAAAGTATSGGERSCDGRVPG